MERSGERCAPAGIDVVDAAAIAALMFAGAAHLDVSLMWGGGLLLGWLHSCCTKTTDCCQHKARYGIQGAHFGVYTGCVLNSCGSALSVGLVLVWPQQHSAALQCCERASLAFAVHGGLLLLRRQVLQCQSSRLSWYAAMLVSSDTM